MTVWVQFQFHLVVGGTEAGRPAKAGTCQGTWFFLILLRGAAGTGSQCVGTPSQPPFHGDVRFGWCDNDPSAGSPTETLLRLHLPLNDKVWTSSHSHIPLKERTTIPRLHRTIQSVGATGGVYKGQGRNHCSLMNCDY